jgi:2-polyprenyl-3-methyl-5-hydroxy-6-metoxy-1,4-benzoquinol methylase
LSQPDTHEPKQSRSALSLAYWASQAASYAPPGGSGWVRFTAKKQHEAVIKVLAPRGGELILDAGCGSGLLTQRLVERGCKVWSVDFCEEMLTHVKGAEKVVHADLLTLDLGVKFNAIVCAGAFNFLDPGVVFKNFAKMLEPGGIVVISVTRPSLAALPYVLSRRLKSVPFTMWSQAELTEFAKKAGLKFVATESMLPHDVVHAFVS